MACRSEHVVTLATAEGPDSESPNRCERGWMECRQEIVMSSSTHDRYLCIYREKGRGKGTFRMEYYGKFHMQRENRPDTANTNFYTINYDYDEMTHWKFLF